MPRLDVHGETSLPLTTSLIHITSSVIEHSQHGNKAVGYTIGATDVTILSTNFGHRETYTSSCFRYQGTPLQSLIDALYGVIDHVEEEARTHLSERSTSIVQRRSGMSEELLGEQFVGLKSRYKIFFVDTYGDPHQQMLWSFSWDSFYPEEITSLQSLETKVVIVVVSLIIDDFLYGFSVSLYNFVDILGDQWSRSLSLISVRMKILDSFSE